MTNAELYEELVSRLTADLRTKFPDAEAHMIPSTSPFGGEPFGWSVEITVGGESWGSSGVNFEPDDPTRLPRHQAQQELASA